MSIYAPTPLLISTGPLSATRCQPCSMMAISRWWAGSPGKVATAPQPSPVCQSAPCLSQFPHTPLLPECVFFFFFFLGRWKQGQKEQCLQCLFLTSAVNVGSIRACVFNSKKMPRAFFFFFFFFREQAMLWTWHPLSAGLHPIMENAEAPRDFLTNRESCAQLDILCLTENNTTACKLIGNSFLV